MCGNPKTYARMSGDMDVKGGRRPRRRPWPLDFEDEIEDDDEDGQTQDIKGRSPCLVSSRIAR